MCGLAGIMGPGINSWDLDIIRDLLTVSTLRGTDSTGVLQGKTESWFGGSRVDYVIEKSASDALYFKWFHSRAKEGNRRILNSTMDNFIACHVRAATKGALTDANAHPFDCGDIIGMHNGTLRDYKYDDKDKTDSEMMFIDISNRGIQKVLEELDPFSAYAIVLFDKTTGEFSFVRNDQRPLHFCIHETRGVMYWASEAWMLEVMMARNTEKMYKQVYYFQPNTIYTVHPQDIKAKNLNPFEQIQFKPKTFHHEKPGKKGRFQSPAVQQQQMLLAPPQEMTTGGKFEIANKTDKIISNIVQLKPEQRRLNTNEKPVINARTKIPAMFCCGCQKRMNLLDVFYATKLNHAGTTIICQDCDNDYMEIAKPKEEVILN